MTNRTEIRRRADGSLDTSLYMARARAERSRQAHSLTAAITQRSKFVTSACVGLLVLLLPHGGQG